MSGEIAGHDYGEAVLIESYHFFGLAIRAYGKWFDAFSKADLGLTDQDVRVISIEDPFPGS